MKDANEVARVIGLDIGTSRIVAAERIGAECRFRSQLNAFVAVPFTKMTERTLVKERVPHLVEGSEILVYGDESETFADLFHLETRRPMSRGVLNPCEPAGLALIRQILQSLTGGAEGDRRRVCFSVPAPPLGAEDTVTYHEAALKQLLSDSGYESMSLNEGLAVIYAELERSNYTGIGISFGGGLCNVCLAYLAVPLFSFSLPKAGDFIDSSVASVANEIETRVRIVKENGFHLNGGSPDKIQQALSVYYADMIRSVVTALKDAFSNSRNVPKIGRPIPVILSGGSTLAAGFRECFEKALAKCELPVSISEVTLSPDPLNSTAKGALTAALAEM